jgi:hypothetical protein
VYDQVKSTEQAWSIYILQTATLYVTRHDVNITQSLYINRAKSDSSG